MYVMRLKIHSCFSHLSCHLVGLEQKFQPQNVCVKKSLNVVYKRTLNIFSSLQSNFVLKLNLFPLEARKTLNSTFRQQLERKTFKQ